MKELLMTLGSCALVVYLIPAVAALILLAGAAWRFKPWKGGGR